MAEWTTWEQFDGILQDDYPDENGTPQVMFSWANLNNAKVVDNNLADVGFFGAAAIANWVNYYNPVLVAAQIPIGSVINEIAVRINVEGFQFANNSQSNLRAIQINAPLLGNNPVENFISYGIARNTKTYSKTVAQWARTQQQAVDFIYNSTSSTGQHFKFYVRENIEFTAAMDNYLYWAETRVNFTRPPNVPRTAYISLF